MSNLKSIVFPVLVFCLLFNPPAIAAASVDEDSMFINYHIHIANDLPPSNVPSLLLHCKSGDRDIGAKAMFQHEDYTWDTKLNLWMSTLFFCNVQWVNNKRRYFEAFVAERDGKRCEEYHNSCLWSVRSDGIYFSNDGSTWINEYPW